MESEDFCLRGSTPVIEDFVCKGRGDRKPISSLPSPLPICHSIPQASAELACALSCNADAVAEAVSNSRSKPLARTAANSWEPSERMVATEGLDFLWQDESPPPHGVERGGRDVTGFSGSFFGVLLRRVFNSTRFSSCILLVEVVIQSPGDLPLIIHRSSEDPDPFPCL